MATVRTQAIGGLVASLALLACGCSSALGFGEERSHEPDEAALLYAQDFETSSGESNCQQEQPAFVDMMGIEGELQRDCDDTLDPLSGSQSLNLWDDGQLVCSSCWAHDSTLWASFLFELKGENFLAVPFALMASSTVPSKELYSSAVGPQIIMRPDGDAALSCHTTKEQHGVKLGAAVGRATFSYDWRSGQSRLWVSGVDTSASLTEEPTVELECPGLEPATGYFIHGRVKPAPGYGNLALDEIRVATSAEALAEP